MKLNLFFLVLLCIFSEVCASQKTTLIEEYKYTVSEKTVIDSFTKRYYGKEYEFSYNRCHLSDSSFKETFLFTNDSSGYTSDTFKVQNQKWYIKVKGVWKVFQYSKTKHPTILKINDEENLVKYLQKTHISGLPVYKLYFQSRKNISTTKIIYFFSPIHGFVAIQIDGILLIRNKIGR